MNKKIMMLQVDAFTNQRFKGNPAAVCVLEEEISAELMQSIAAENNLAETAFVSRLADDFSLRWFTPTVEINLCGHATLATAHVLWEEGLLATDKKALFHSLSGLLTAEKKGDWIELNFPAVLTTNQVALPEKALQALGVKPVNSVFAKDRYLVEVASPEEVLAAEPDFQVLKHYDPVVVTSPGNSNMPYDFVSRSFVPSHGINEDPVTGSSHCGLVPYYAAQWKKHAFHAYQCSKRGGELKLQLAGDRVLMAGQAVTVIKGHLLL
ncbi:phenazine biosynthesis protein PhzF family [Filimonas lacunae]|uniref:Phenazine biosynthesis protein PhzF family n=1 Tax=Filimonas lacunae TaxID=477680 RepID=A0A173MPZ7_9BACT|nr:PhzF family phenazine biosynthesis protein [Filimonas lacunae]BAV09519.1 isomerase, PhzC-PhzF family [Filimonas lacunae]SIS74554.1 phenazine biosynthesis protein PhzF family [Filimonas lacunae]